MQKLIEEGTRIIEGYSNAIEKLSSYSKLCPEHLEEVVMQQCELTRKACRISQGLRDLVLVDWMNR
jgi:hypothetical protein